MPGLCTAEAGRCNSAGANLVQQLVSKGCANSALACPDLADSFHLVSCKPFSRHCEAVQQTQTLPSEVSVTACVYFEASSAASFLKQF